MIALSDELSRLVTGYERWAPLTQIGWAITDLAKPDAYDQAAELLSAGEQQAARRSWRIIGMSPAGWNQPPCVFSV